MNCFDIGKWMMKLMDTSRSYFSLLEFIDNKDAFNIHTNSKTIYMASENGDLIEDKDPSIKKYFTDELKNDIEHAIENYSNQMIVILATYIETIHSEFFQSLFTSNNKLIYQYSSNNSNQNGYIKLDIILNSNSKDEIIDNLITVAKKNIVNGSLVKINERIFKLTKYHIDIELIKNIQINILDKRNKIVHEGTSIFIKEQDIKENFELAEKYLCELGRACKKTGACYSDQANWL